MHLDLPACPISLRYIVSCSAWTKPSTKRSARRCVGCAALAEKAGDEPALVWTPRVWRREQSARSLCDVCITTDKNRCLGGIELKWVVVVDLDQQFLLSQ